jgi:hypothetical protein
MDIQIGAALFIGFCGGWAVAWTLFGPLTKRYERFLISRIEFLEGVIRNPPPVTGPQQEPPSNGRLTGTMWDEE